MENTKTNEKLNTKMVTEKITCSYPHLEEKTEDLSGRLAYTLSIPLPEAQWGELKQIMSNAAINEWGPKFKDLTGVTHYVVDGDAEDSVYAGRKRFAAKAQKNRPGLVRLNDDGLLVQVDVSEIDTYFYPGAVIRASVTAYANDKGGRKTVAFALNNVMHVEHGERIGGSSNPVDDFGEFASGFADAPNTPSSGDFF